jgi:tetratricopeptide (TPR) repeat protein
VRESPEEETYWEAVDEAARGADSPDLAEAAYNDVLSRKDLDLEVRRLVGRRAVEFLEEWYEDTTKSIAVLETCIRHDASNSWALEKLSLLLTLAERWDDLLGTYDQALQNVDDDTQRLHLLEEAARIAKDFAGQANRASDYLKLLLLLRPEDAALATSLERRLEQQGRFADLVDVWRARLRVIDEAGEIELRLSIAKTLLEPLGKAAESLAAAAELLSGGHAEEQTCELMERLATLDLTPLPTKRAALEMLEQKYASDKRTDDTIRILRRALEIADAPVLQGGLYQKLVHWLEVAARLDEAQASAGKWLAVDPSQAASLEKLEELANKTQGFQAYADALVRASDGAKSTGNRVELLLRAARVFREQADIPHSATELYARVLLDHDTGDSERLLAARQLRELLTSPAQAGQRLDVLEKLSVLEPEIAAQSEVLREAAQLAERLGDDERSLRLWNECLERNAEDKLALDWRIDILKRIERWSQLLDAYRARTEQSSDEVEGRSDWVSIAKLYDEKLGDPARAIQTWRHIEKQFARNEQTVDALYDLCFGTERWREASELLDGAAEEAESNDRKTELLARLGDVLRVNLGDPQQALTEYQRGLALLPNSTRCREGVIALIDTAAVREAAAETLAGAYRTCQEWQAILDMLETRLDAASSGDAKQAILTEAAEISELRIDAPAQALEHVQRAFSIAPTPTLEGELLRLADNTDDWGAAISGYQRALRHCADAERTTELLVEQGRLQEERLGDWTEALTAYRRVVELDHNHLEGARAVIRAAGNVHRWHDASWAFIESAKSRGELDESVVAAWAEIAAKMDSWTEALAELEATLRDSKDISRTTSHDVKFQLAIWQHEKRQARDLAESLLKEAVAEHKAIPSLQLLIELQRAAPSRDLVTSLLQLSELLPNPLAQLDEAGRVALGVVHDPDLAKPILANTLATAELLLREEETAEGRAIASWCVDRLVEIALSRGDHHEAFAQLTHASQIPFEAPHLWNLKHRAAVIATSNLEQPATAIALCEDVLSEQPDRTETVNLLAQLYESQGKLAPLVALFRKELELPRNLERRLETRLQLSRVLGLQAGTDDDRVASLMDNLAEQAGHPRTIEALTLVLMAADRALELYEVLCTQADLVNAAEDGRGASELYAQAGHLARARLADDDAAMIAFRHSVGLNPTCPVLDALADIHTTRGEHSEAVLWLKQRLELTPSDDTDARRATLVRLGTALQAAGEVEEAVLVLGAGLDRDPAGNGVRALLIALQEASESWRELAGLLAEGVPFLEESAAKVDYLSRGAQVRWHRLDDVTGAIPLLEQAVVLAPSDRQLRLWLGEASRLGGVLPRARQLLSDLLEEFGRRRTPERAQVHFQLALIDRAEGQLGASLEHLDAASSIARGNALILRTLGDVAREKGELERAETAYRALLLLVGRGPSAPGADPNAQGESAILYELYKIATEKQDGDRARDLLDSALEKSEHPAEAAVLEQTLRDANEWELLHQALERRQTRVRGIEEERALAKDRAEVLTHLGRSGEALELRLKLLAMDPSDSGALEQAAQLAEQSQSQERFRHAVIELAESLQADSPERSCQLWLRLGQDAELHGDLKTAANFFERAQVTKANPEQTFKALQRIHRETGDMHGLTLALERFIDQSDEVRDSELVCDAMFRLAEIDLCNTAGRERGMQNLSRALERDPQNERAVAILVTAVEVVAPTKDMLVRLEELARATGNQTALGMALFHAAMGSDPSLELLGEAVALAGETNETEKLGLLLRRTIDVARKANQLAKVVWAFERHSEQMQAQQRWSDAHDLLAEAVKVAPKKRKLGLQLQLALLLDQKMGDAVRAAQLYEKLAEASPDDARTWQPLVEIYRRTGQTDKLEGCLSRAEKHAPGDDDRRALRLERIRLMIDEARFESAEQALRETLAETHDEQAADLLIELLETQERMTELQALVAESLSSAMDRADDPAIVRFALRLSKIHESAEESDEALAVLRDAQSVVRNNRDLINGVLRLLPASEQDERANLMESLLPAAAPENVGSLAVQLAELRADLGDDAGQERAMELGYKADPSNQVLRERLEAWYRERDHWAPLVELLVIDARQRSEDDQAVARFLEAARIYDAQLGDAFAAGDVLLEALDLAPHSLDVLEPLTQHLTTSGRADQAALALTSSLEDSDVSESDLPTLHFLRASARARLGQGNLALTREAIADLDFASSHGRTGTEEALAELLERQRELSSAAGDDSVERGAVLRLAGLLPRLDRADDALGALSVWVDSHPADAEAAKTYADLAFAREDWNAASEASFKLFDISEGEERIQAGLKHAEALDRRGTPMDARPVLEMLYAEAPGDERIGQQLRRAYEAAGAHQELARLLLDNAAKSDNNEHRYRFLVDAGELLIDTGEPHAESVRALEEALRLKPQDHRATLGLARALTLHGDIERACEALGEGIKTHGKRRSPELAELQHAMAQVADIAGDDEGRFAWLDAALTSDRKNGVVASELALFAMAREDYDSAIKALQLVTLLKENCPMSRAEAYLRQGQISAARGDNRKAALLAKRALTADADYDAARAFLEQLGIG